MHIGLIGGIGPAATVFYYEGLVDAFKDSELLLDLTIVHADVHTLVRNVNLGAARAQSEEYRRLTLRLQHAGADFVVVTSLGGHFCIEEFEAISPLPVLNAVPVLADALKQKTYSSVGLLGTRVVMQSELYGALAEQVVVLPQGPDMAKVNDVYFSLGTTGKISDKDRQFLFEAGQKLIDRGAEVVLLGGTDLFVAFRNFDCGYRVLDCAEVHIEAIFERAINNPPHS